MIRLCFLMFIVGCCSMELCAKADPIKPNIVLIIADDIGYSDLGCYGSFIKTPNIDEIARTGLIFTNFYLTTSSCSPSRSSIISGRYPHNTGAAELHTYLPRHIVTFPELLKNEGYYTAQAGKWHLGESPRAGFAKIQDNVDSNGFGGEDLWVRTLKERPKDKPFFLWLASTDAHRPWGKNKFEGHNSPEHMVPPGYLTNTVSTKNDLANYADEVSRFDFYVGQVARELAQQGVADNTLLIVMSDNGSPFPRAKTRLYASGIKSFFVVRWGKKLQAGMISKSLLSAVDLAPTIIEAAGLEQPTTFQGRSFLSVLAAPDRKFRNYAFAEHNWHDYQAAERMVATPNYLYISNLRPGLSNPGSADVTSSPAFRDLVQLKNETKLTALQSDIFIKPRSKEELYNLDEDPIQSNNIVDISKYKSILLELRNVLHIWRDETADAISENITKDWFSRDDGSVLPSPKARGDMPGGNEALKNNSKGPF